jgi:hypothetical protein
MWMRDGTEILDLAGNRNEIVGQCWQFWRQAETLRPLTNACIHAYDGYMEKLQILFPEPQLLSLRRMARRQDRPVSELVRAAVDAWLERHEPWAGEVREEPPVYHCGELLVGGEDLREAANGDRIQP